MQTWRNLFKCQENSKVNSNFGCQCGWVSWSGMAVRPDFLGFCCQTNCMSSSCVLIMQINLNSFPLSCVQYFIFCSLKSYQKTSINKSWNPCIMWHVFSWKFNIILRHKSTTICFKLTPNFMTIPCHLSRFYLFSMFKHDMDFG